MAILSRLLCARGLLVCVAMVLTEGPAPAAEPQAAAPESVLNLSVRTQVETSPGSGRRHTVTRPETWDPRKTAVVVCDMWDKHWCAGATRRVAEMARRMNEVVAAARRQGALIIHCPSDTMDFYKDTPQRRLAQQAPVVETEVPLERWCRLNPQREGELPIDDSDGGCDCEPQCRNYKAWSRQIETVAIEEGDAVTDSAEAFYLMKQRGIENVVVMGVHTNMCVLGRPFSIRQMVMQGQNVVLMRDMTDTMYNPRRAPFVSHFTGTDLVVEHIEKHWCPTITSVAFLGGREFRFSEDTRPHVAFVIAEDEYKTEETLPAFARKHLGRDFRTSFVFGGEGGGKGLPGIEVLDEADVLFLSVRRRALPREQMDVIRRFIAAGKPVVGIRTANHAFALRDGKPAVGWAVWPEFDRDVIGGNYNFHHGTGPKVAVRPAEDAADHPILAGIDVEKLISHGSLYKVSPLAESAKALLIGTIPRQPSEPVAWTNRREDGGSTFYTSLGHPQDFEQPDFNRLLVNAVLWATERKPADQAASRTVPVRGTVTFNGQPLEGAIVQLHSRRTTYVAVGVTDARGRYSLRTFEPNDGSVLGEHIVTVSRPGILPALYADVKTSVLTVSVQDGENEFDFDLAD